MSHHPGVHRCGTNHLTPFEAWGAFLDERLKPLACVLRRAREIEGAALEGDARGERRLERLVDRFFGEAHGDWSLRSDLPGDPLRLVEPRFLRDNARDEP